MQNRFVFIVEGDCEVDFVNNKMLPYLYSLPKAIEREWVFNAQKITTNRKKNIKGGNVGFEYLRNEVNRVSAQSTPWITTFLDFFRLPNDFPGFSANACNIELIEKAMACELNVPFFIPYIQKYEYETLLFVDVDAFSSVVDEEFQLQCIADTIQSYRNAEEINGGLETAPSKRLNHIFGYEKVHDSHLIMENLTIEQISMRCPRFKNWLKHIETIIDG